MWKIPPNLAPSLGVQTSFSHLLTANFTHVSHWKKWDKNVPGGWTLAHRHLLHWAYLLFRWRTHPEDDRQFLGNNWGRGRMWSWWFRSAPFLLFWVTMQPTCHMAPHGTVMTFGWAVPESLVCLTSLKHSMIFRAQSVTWLFSRSFKQQVLETFWGIVELAWCRTHLILKIVSWLPFELGSSLVYFMNIKCWNQGK